MPIRSTIPLGRVAGIRIAAHWSAGITVGLFTWILASYLRGTASTAGVLVAAILGALALIACLLAHELAHSIVATRHGVRVERIVLWLLGGASELAGEPRDAPISPSRATVRRWACPSTPPRNPRPLPGNALRQEGSVPWPPRKRLTAAGIGSAASSESSCWQAHSFR
ncbi:site-2 protease family protein [Nocardia tengchongensis]|uniref:site-2 protease family protein n=1 Tax=Nocardia tengchongensis TaxID=2055889 RepID=UPI00341017F3